MISALISPAGPAAQIVRAWTEERFELIVSPGLIGELEEVLARPKFRKWISESTSREFVTAITDAGVSIADPPAPAGLSPDPDDDYLVALARTASADWLVSGDRHLTELVDSSPPVLTPRGFLSKITDEEPG
jgi:uncharacterized protein